MWFLQLFNDETKNDRSLCTHLPVYIWPIHGEGETISRVIVHMKKPEEAVLGKAVMESFFKGHCTILEWLDFIPSMSDLSSGQKFTVLSEDMSSDL